MFQCLLMRLVLQLDRRSCYGWLQWFIIGLKRSIYVRHPSLSLSFCLSVILSVCIYIFFRVLHHLFHAFPLSLCQSSCVSVFISLFVCVTLSLSLSLYLSLSLSLSVILCVHVSVFISFVVCVSLSLSLSLSPSVSLKNIIRTASCSVCTFVIHSRFYVFFLFFVCINYLRTSIYIDRVRLNHQTLKTL